MALRAGHIEYTLPRLQKYVNVMEPGKMLLRISSFAKERESSLARWLEIIISRYPWYLKGVAVLTVAEDGGGEPRGSGVLRRYDVLSYFPKLQNLIVVNWSFKRTEKIGSYRARPVAYLAQLRRRRQRWRECEKSHKELLAETRDRLGGQYQPKVIIAPLSDPRFAHIPD